MSAGCRWSHGARVVVGRHARVSTEPTLSGNVHCVLSLFILCLRVGVALRCLISTLLFG